MRKLLLILSLGAASCGLGQILAPILQSGSAPNPLAPQVLVYHTMAGAGGTDAWSGHARGNYVSFDAEWNPGSTGAIHFDWGDGSSDDYTPRLDGYGSGHADHTYTIEGSKTITVTSANHWLGVNKWGIAGANEWDENYEDPPLNALVDLEWYQGLDRWVPGDIHDHFALCAKAQKLYLQGNQYSGPLPDPRAFGSSLTLYDVHSNNFSGAWPDFSSNPNLTYIDMHNNPLMDRHWNASVGHLPKLTQVLPEVTDGIVPDLSEDVSLTSLYVVNITSTVPGSFATQKNLSSLTLFWGRLSAENVNQILADLVVSLGISGRVACTVDLSGGRPDGGGGPNAAPTGQGLTDKATLIAAGWTVTAN